VGNNAIHSVLLNKNTEQTDIGTTLAELVKVLKNVDDNDNLAKLNETTIRDNNGGRIEL
jgi:hypothetical protein